MSYDDITRVRFPSLKQDQVYLDNASGTQILGESRDAINDYLNSNNAQIGASYSTGKRATARHEEAHRAVAKYIGANVDEVVFGPSTTQLIRNLSYSLQFNPGDEIVVSTLENEANISPWLDLAQRENLVIRWWKPVVTVEGRLKSPKLGLNGLNGLHNVLTPEKTRLVVFSHASDIIGTIHNIKALSEQIHHVGALVYVDGAVVAPHRPLDVKHWAVDFYAFSWDKAYGPHIATLYASWSAQTQMRSLGHTFSPSSTLRDKLGLDGGSPELCQAVIPIVKYIGSSPASIKSQEDDLQICLLRYLGNMSSATVYGLGQDERESRLPIVSFTLDGWDSKEFVEALESNSNFGISWGCFGSHRLVRDTLGLGPTGAIRVSMAHYNTGNETEEPSVIGCCANTPTVDEIIRLTEAMTEVLKRGQGKVYVPSIEDRLLQYGNSLK